ASRPPGRRRSGAPTCRTAAPAGCPPSAPPPRTAPGCPDGCQSRTPCDGPLPCLSSSTFHVGPLEVVDRPHPVTEPPRASPSQRAGHIGLRELDCVGHGGAGGQASRHGG